MAPTLYHEVYKELFYILYLLVYWEVCINTCKALVPHRSGPILSIAWGGLPH